MPETRISDQYREDLRHTGSTDQLYSVRRLQLVEGAGEGLRLIEVCTSAGLRAVFCESRALDLLELHFKGVNIGFSSKNGWISGRVLPVEGAFTPSWPGGMLATCGLRNAGPDNRTGQEYHPLHGWIGGMAAEHVGIDIDREEGKLVISGQMRESALFGCHLLLERHISIPLTGSSITFSDTVLNLAAESEPIFLLYHFNFGFPFLGPELALEFMPGQVIPRTEIARAGLAEYDRIVEPVDGYEEQVFFHLPLPADGPDREVRLTRRDLGITAMMQFSSAELPVLIEWKSMKSGDYALGIEPSTSMIRGRAEELVHGYDQDVEGFGKRSFTVKLELTQI